MVGILGRKLGMTQSYDDKGQCHGLTVIEAGPCVVIQVKVADKDGYDAIQVGFEPLDLKKTNKPLSGHFKGNGSKTAYRVLREFRVDDPSAFTSGQELTVEQFKPGQLLDIIGTSKGKGFAGTIKRHHFHRGPMTHGSHNKRPPGSIGNSAWPSRVVKGRKMPGQLGNKRSTVPMVRVFSIDAEKNLLFINGPAPGGRNGLVSIQSAVKDHKGDAT
ncbi:MAG: 50S ribosomal protein L3 [Candidatus Alcyoniella australis]|nr:50S ribosomal protein L3 [Candidatus Alcyoniella australis]